MRLLGFLFQTSGSMVAVAMLAAAASGGANAALLAWINHTLTTRSGLVAIFGALVAVKLLTAFASRQLLARVAQDALARLRQRLCRCVADAPLRDVERAGTPRVLTALTDDVGAVGSALAALPSLAANLTVIAACSAYLAWLSPRAFVFVIVVVAGGIWVYRWLSAHAMVSLRRARGEQERLFTHFRALTEGLIELKRHRARRDAFFTSGIDATSAALARENVRATARFGVAHLWSQAVVYGALAAVLFGFGVRGASTLPGPVLTGFVLTILYLTGPLAAAIVVIPTFGRASVALDRVQALGLTLEPAPPPAVPQSPFSPAWQAIELRGVVHTYHADEDTFTVGPISMTIRRGEILFVTGGNGSGKSTLAKLVAGLYEPERGEILVDGVPVDASNRAHYRELSATVLSQFFLFDTLLGFEGSDLDARAARLLARLELQRKVRIEDGRLSTVELSQGQRKRLALLTAALEERSLYVLDEWAADQDAAFKQVFYRELLPELRAAGHAVVVISHDERYFDVADRIVRLDEGRLVEPPDVAPRAERTASSNEIPRYAWPA